jgi:hypothetical protein
MTVYNHLARLGLQATFNRVNQKTFDVLEEFRGDATVDKLSFAKNVGRETIRYHLRRGIDMTDWAKSPYPKPEVFNEIKIWNALKEDETLFDDPDKLAEITFTPIYAVRRYLDRYFEKAANRGGSIVPNRLPRPDDSSPDEPGTNSSSEPRRNTQVGNTDSSATGSGHRAQNKGVARVNDPARPKPIRRSRRPTNGQAA